MLTEKKGPSAKRTGMSILMVLAMMFSGISAYFAVPGAVGQEISGGEYGGEFRVALQEQPSTLNPLATLINNPARQVIDLVYDSLGRIDPYTLELVPWVASGWTVDDENPNIVSLELREGVLWHNGDALTLEDVEYTFGEYGYNVDYVSGTTLDTANNIITFEFDSPDSRFFSEMMLMKLLPEDFTAASDPMGCGPFSFQTTSDTETVLAAFGDYFYGRPYLDGIRYSYDYSDNLFNTTFEYVGYKLVMGELDFIGWDLTAFEVLAQPIEARGNITQLVKEANITALRSSGFDFWYLGMNCDVSNPLNDPALRKAIAYSIDKTFLAAYDESGSLEVTDSIVSKYNSPWYNNSQVTYAFDIAEANKILQIAGYNLNSSTGWRDRPNGQSLSLALLGPPQDDEHYTKVTNIVTWFEMIGVNVTIVPDTLENHSTAVQNDSFDLYLDFEQRTGIDPDFLGLMYHSTMITTNDNLLNFQPYSTVWNETLVEKMDNVTLSCNLDYTNLVEVIQVTKNDAPLGVGDYDVDLETGMFTLDAAVALNFTSDFINISYRYLPFDHLMYMANRQMDMSMRGDYIKEAQGYISEQSPSIPIFSFNINHAYNNTVYEGWVQMLGGINNFWSFINLKNIIRGELVITTFDAYPGYVTEGGSLNLAITIEDLVGNPVEDITIALEGEGTFDLDSMTYADGRYTVPYTAPDTNTARTLTLKVTASKMAYDPDERETLLTVHPDIRSFDIDIDRGATSLDSGNSTDIIIIVTDKDSGQAVSDANIVLTISPVGLGGYLTDYSGTTSGSSFSTEFGADNVTVDTTFRITVRVSKDGYVDGEQSTSISVSRDPDIEAPGSGFLGLPAPSLIMVLMLVSGLALVYATGRRRRR